MSKLTLVFIGLCLGGAIGFGVANPASSIFRWFTSNPEIEISCQDRTSKKKSNLKLNDFDFDKPSADKGTDFVINGVNATSTIQELTTIAGKSIAELEAQMRPGASGPGGSTAGFLGPNESLLQVLAEDNELVVKTFALTHQKIAAPLLILAQLYSEEKPGTLKFGDTVIYINAFQSSNGFQHSPFGDELKTSDYLTLFNTVSKQKLSFSPLVPKMIYRYGFYEGHGTRYRVEPEKIINFFGKDFLNSFELPQ